MRTTPEAIDLQRDFAAMLDGGDVACAMEVSSHALELHRADAIHWAVAIFTNLTQDHLDFHPTMEDYFAAKRRLFEAGPRARGGQRRRPLRTPAGRGAARRASPSASRAPTPPCAATDVAFGPDRVHVHRRRAAPSRHAAAAAASTCSTRWARWPPPARLGVADDTSIAALAGAGRVPGRFEPVDAGQDFAVLVDYAHTPDSLENVLRAAREIAQRRVHRRLRRRRRPRPRQAPADGPCRTRRWPTSSSSPPTTRARRTPTRSSPRSWRAPAAGLGSRRWSTAAPPSARAVALAQEGDVVVIAGKGHEQGQEFAGGRKIPFDDVTVAREALRVRDWSAQRIAARQRRRPRAPGDDRRRPGPRRGRLPRGRAGRPLRRHPRRARRRRPLRRRRAARRRLGRARRRREHVRDLRAMRGAVLATATRIAALGRLARAWREELGCAVVGITGSTARPRPRRSSPGCSRRTAPRWPRGRTSTPRSACRSTSSRPSPGWRRWCSRWRCAAPARSPSWPTSPAPDVGVSSTSGPSTWSCWARCEPIAAAKAELIVGLEPGGTAVVPAGDPLLAPHLRDDVRTLTLRRRRRRAPHRAATARA